MALCLQFGLDKLWTAIPQMRGNQLWFVVGILVLVSLFFLAYKALSPGTARLAQEEKERSDTVAVLERENARKDAEIARKDALIAKQDHEIRELLTIKAGFEFINQDPPAIRLYADRVERQQREKQQREERRDLPP